MKRLLSLFVSTVILCIIYTQIDFAGLVSVFRNCNPIWMVISLTMVVPITFFSSWRLQQIVPPQVSLGLWEANKLILAASVLNMVLPSKMGDIAKAYFMRDGGTSLKRSGSQTLGLAQSRSRSQPQSQTQSQSQSQPQSQPQGKISGTLSLSIVVFEKACDFLSLLLWCGFGLLLYPVKGAFFISMTVAIISGLVVGVLVLAWGRFARFFFKLVGGLADRIVPGKIGTKVRSLEASWGEMQTYFWSDRTQLLKITVTSVFIWLLHLLQIWFFILALNAWVNPITNLALSPLAILAGLLPLTFAGVGTRDAALIFLYQPYFSEATGAALGLLCSSRYLLPAIGGLPFLSQYLNRLNQIKQVNPLKANGPADS